VVVASLQGLPAFLVYFLVAAILCGTYVMIYTRITRHDEFLLIETGNTAAAVAFGMSLLGFAMPLASAIANSASLIDVVVWGIVALLVQTGLYFVARWRMPAVSDKIAAGDMAAALWLGFLSLGGGLLNAASMTT
jgi:putative membrane protein